MMAERDELFDRQVFEAYDRVQLSDEAQDRILANLLAHQAQVQAEAEAEAAEASAAEAPVAGDAEVASDKTVAMPHPQVEEPAKEERQAPVVPMTPRRRRWVVALPVAAAVLAAMVVVRMTMFAPTAASDAAKATSEVMEQTSVTNADKTSVDADAGIAADAAGTEEEEAFEGQPTDGVLPEPEELPVLGTVDLYPIVELGDGTTLTALIDGLTTRQLEATQVGELVGAAKAHPSDATETVDCEVFLLADGSEGYAVRYAGEESYWYCYQAPSKQ